jgi:hypothetical protein
LKDKESQRWLDGLRAAAKTLPHHPHVVLMGDRESDMYDLFVAPRPAHVDLLVRICRGNRRVEHPAKYLDAALEAAPVQGVTPIEISARPNRKARTAKMAVRWLSLEIHAPQNGPQRPAVRLTFILVKEIDPPQGEKPVRWLLATTLSVDDLQGAVQCVQWYAYRWIIERFHFVLKSGCKLEDRQLESADHMKRAIPVFSIVAWRLLWLTLQARETPQAPCTMVLDEMDWQALYAKVHRTDPLPTTPPTLRDAVRMIAQLGGFLGRKGDGEPGPQTLWRGLRRLDDLVAGWSLARRQSCTRRKPVQNAQLLLRCHSRYGACRRRERPLGRLGGCPLVRPAVSYHSWVTLAGGEHVSHLRHLTSPLLRERDLASGANCEQT